MSSYNVTSIMNYGGSMDKKKKKKSPVVIKKKKNNNIHQTLRMFVIFA